MKKVVSIILCMVMLTSLLVIPAQAVEPKKNWIIYSTADENYTESGSWGSSTNEDLQGPVEGAPSRYAAYEGSCSWVPQFKQGKYKVFIYKTAHEASQNNQIYEIVHRGRTDYALKITISFI